MANQNFPLKNTSTDFEKAALERFRLLADCVPQACRVSREPWDSSTVLCLNFEACPQLLYTTRQKADWLISASQQLGLAHALIFKVGTKVQGWTVIA